MKETKGFKYWIMIVGIMFSNILVMADLAIYVVVNNLYETFPNQLIAVNFIVSGTALMVMLSSLVASKLMKTVGKKNLLLIAGVVFCVSAIGGGLIENAWYMAAMRAVAGVTMGLANVAAVAILTEYHEDEAKRARMIGLYNTVMPLVGSGLSAAAGVLAMNGWKNVFNVYWLAVPMVVLTAVCLPDDHKAGTVDKENTVREKHSMGVSFWVMTVGFFLCVLGTMMTQMFYSVYIVEHNLGDAAYTGLVNTICGFGSVAANLICGFIFVKLQRKLNLASFFLPVIGCLILIFLPGRLTLIIGLFLVLAGYGVGFFMAYAYAPTLCPESGMEFAIGVATATYSLGTFLSTYAVTGIQSLFGIETFTEVLPIILAVMVILLAAEFLLPKSLKKPVEG